jgi:PAS domain S-box-containing protein
VYQRTILDNLPSGVISLDLEGKITEANRGAIGILGREMQDMRGLRVERVSPVFYQVFRQTSFNGRPELRMEVSIEIPGSANPVPLSLSSLVLRNAEAEPIGCLLIFTDQSLIKQMEREIRRSESLAALGRFAASIAHEIRNPLVSIKTFTRLLPERYEDEEFRTSFSSLADQEIDRISGLVDHLLNLVRPSMVKQETVDLRSLLDDVLQVASVEWAKSGIETVRRNWEIPCLIRGDGEKLKQVFINLIQNAVQAMETGGSLTVALRRLEGIPSPGSGEAMLHVSPIGSVVVDVQDTGTGIPPELLDTIFEPFFTTRDKGTGLGLSICHKIVADHGGKIFVSSALGEGTTFTVCLPLLVGMVKEPAPVVTVKKLRKSLL